jgi:hypothetical protein
MTKQTITTRIIPLFLATLILLPSCASTTLIQSSPSEAKIYIDGQPSGTTPYSYTDTKIVGSVTTVRLEKEGYEQMNTTFSRSEQADVGAIIGGLFVWVPFLWTMKYNPSRTYELTPLDENKQSNVMEQPTKNTKSKADRLRELKALLDDEILTPEEYEKEKQKVLEENE